MCDPFRPEPNKHYFSLKGESAENAVQHLASQSFLREWCYPNPKDEDNKEICDLVALFDGVLLIWQIKSITFTGNDQRYVKKALEHPVKQLLGAERRLMEYGDPIELTNVWGQTTILEREKIRRVFRIVASVGDGQVPFNIIDEVNHKIIHTFDISIQTILNELDTISDFSKYLEEKESLYEDKNLRQIVLSRETDLLGDYLLNNKSFDHIKKFNAVYFEEGIWDEYITQSSYEAKRKADSVSYFWDHLIDITRTCPEPEYREVATELSRLDRFDRRRASKDFFSAHEIAVERNRCFRRTVDLGTNVSMVYLFTPRSMSRDQRKAQLGTVCYVVRDKLRHNPIVIGIATEIGVAPPHSFDFVLMDFPTWEEENHKAAMILQKKYGILENPSTTRGTEDEYPEES